MTDTMDDAIDVLLREQFEGPVADDGFCASVMERLPARRRRNKWPMMAGTVAGVATCGISLSSAPIAYNGWQDWLSGAPSAATMALFIAMMSMAILALAWTVAEADDRSDSGRMAR